MEAPSLHLNCPQRQLISSIPLYLSPIAPSPFEHISRAYTESDMSVGRCLSAIELITESQALIVKDNLADARETIATVKHALHSLYPVISRTDAAQC